MNALPQSFAGVEPLLFERMSEDNLDGVMEIEVDVFPFPWTRQVFHGSIREGYECWVARDAMGILAGYFVLMRVVDEAHLLTIAVRRGAQGRGIGRQLLDKVIKSARTMKTDSLLLEVRPSNERALEIYSHYGFGEIGRRKDYYQASLATREDAIVMRLSL